MSRQTGTIRSAWGLEITSRAVRIARVRREHDRYTIDHCRVVETAIDDDSMGDQINALLAESASDEKRIAADSLSPIAFCLPDDDLFHAKLDLPHADDEATTRMAGAQLEVLLAAPRDGFRWGWRRLSMNGHASPQVAKPVGHGERSAEQPVWLVAARMQTIDRLGKFELALNNGATSPRSVTSRALALAAAAPILDGGTCGTSVLIDLNATGAAIMVMRDGRLIAHAAIDEGWSDCLDAIAERHGLDEAQARRIVEADNRDHLRPRTIADWDRALDNWTRRIGRAYQDAVNTLPKADQPVFCRVFADVPKSTDWLTTLRRHLPIDVQVVGALRDQGVDASRIEPQFAAAVGAAIAAIADSSPAIAIESRGTSEAAAVSTWRRPVILLGMWLIAVVAGLYLCDVVESRRLTALVAGDAIQTQRRELRQHIDVGRFLQASGPTALAVLQDLSDRAPENVVLTDWTYSRQGQLTIKGWAPTDNDIHQFHAALATASTLQEAEIGNLSREGDRKWTFDMTARPARWFTPIHAKKAKAESAPQGAPPQPVKPNQDSRPARDEPASEPTPKSEPSQPDISKPEVVP